MSKPPIGRRWKPGQSGNPRGRPRGTGQIAKALSFEEFSYLMNLLFYGTVRDIEKIAKSKTHRPIMVLVARALVGDWQRGGFRVLNALLDRLLGKPE